MTVIHKHTLRAEPHEIQRLELTNLATPIAAGSQGTSIVVWELHNKEEKSKVPLEFVVVFTRHPFPLEGECWEHLNTVQIGSIVCHVFWRYVR